MSCYCTILKRENLVLKVTSRSGKKKVIVKRKQTKIDENSTKVCMEMNVPL